MTHATTNTELHVPLDWTDTTLTHLSLGIISKTIDGLEEKINRILLILEMPKRANTKQKKPEHIQILPTPDEDGEYTIPPEVKEKIINSSTLPKPCCCYFSQDHRKGCNCTGKSSSGADVEGTAEIRFSGPDTVFCWSAVHLNKTTKCRQLLNGFKPGVLSTAKKVKS